MHDKNIISYDGLKKISHSLETIGASLMSLINFTEDLIPEELYKDGLKDCITKICTFDQKEKKINISLSFLGEFLRLDKNIEIKIFKLFNALVSYIITQSKPKNVEVSIHQTDSDFKIKIADDGTGFNFSKISSSGINEIAYIKSLAESLNGSFTLDRDDQKRNIIVIDLKL